MKWNFIYKELISRLIRNINNNECMIQRRQCYPGIHALKIFLDLELFDFDNSKKISFNQ